MQQLFYSTAIKKSTLIDTDQTMVIIFHETHNLNNDDVVINVKNNPKGKKTGKMFAKTITI